MTVDLVEQEKLNLPCPEFTLPHRGSGAYKATIANLKALLRYYGITCQYDEIRKEQRVILPTESDHDLTEGGNFATLKSLLSLNDMPQSSTDLLPSLMIDNSVNPVLDFIADADSKSSLDVFRLFADSLVVASGDEDYRDLALKTWLLQCVAAADYARHAACGGAAKFELVLVLQGEQGIGKSTWLKNLLPSHLRTNYFAENEHLDPNDVNSLRRCLSSWICEIGELDATFRKSDMERLKAFLSQSVDKIRLPYDKAISNYKRRTSFSASVNTSEFLVDRSGNRRFLPLALVSINHMADNDKLIKLLWSQIWSEYKTRGTAQWWANEELEAMLVDRHARHTEISPIDEMLGYCFNMDSTISAALGRHFTVTNALITAGVSNPTKTQVKEAKSFIEKCGFTKVQKSGIQGYYLHRNAVDHYE